MIPLTLQQKFALAGQHFGRGAAAEAEALCQEVLAAQPGQPDTMNLLGLIAFGRGDLAAAVEWLRQATARQPDCPYFHSNLSVALNAIGDAVAAEKAARDAVALAPDYAEGHFNLGIALAGQERLDEALAEYRLVLTWQPAAAGVWGNLGNELKRQGFIEEAMQAYRKAADLLPDDATTHGVVVQNLRYLPGLSTEDIAREEALWDARFARPLAAAAPAPVWNADPDRRLRVGYVSADFREHVVGLNVLPLLEGHDPSQVEVFCYSCSRSVDAITERIRRAAAGWREVAMTPDAALADQIRADRIDVLVDLALHSAGNRLLVFARRPALVQVSFAGYPGASGLTSIDASLSDAALEGASPDAREVPGAMLLDSFWCYAGLASDVATNELPAVVRGGVTFGSLCNPWKVNPAVLELWSRVLGATAGSRLRLLSPLGSHRDFILSTLERHSVSRDRVDFVERKPRAAYLAEYREIDVVLDSLPYNGHTTSLDAFWMGVPVVTLVGSTIAGRAGLSQARSLGLERELVAHSEADFVRLATALASDLPRLAELRRTLRDRMRASVLMDAPRFVRGVEAAYRALWRRRCASLV